jgi:hypothetical protein
VLWQGGTAYIIGGGPSLKVAAGCHPREKEMTVLGPAISAYLAPIQDKHVIGCNDAYRLGKWVDACWFGDERWWKWNWKELMEFAGLKASCHPHTKKVKWVKTYSRGESRGLDIRKNCVSWNSNTGGSAVNFAYHMGVKHVVLIGFDMKHGEKGQNNWHENHKRLGQSKNPYERFLENFNHIARDAKKHGLEIYNAGPDSALDQFPMITLEEAVKRFG